jgi:hypothetical protein
MQPSELKSEQFSGYPPQGRQMVISRIALLRQLPVSFVALLLRELIGYDWKFPPEQKDLNAQLAYLESRSSEERRRSMDSFERLRLSRELERFDWVTAPGQFSEQLTAHLWTTHQIDAFRTAAIDYMKKATAAPREPLAMPRLAIVVVGQGVAENQYRLFRKLRPQGVYCSQVKSENGFRMLLDAVAARAKAHPAPYGHWYIDGGNAQTVNGAGLTCVSYNALTPARAMLQDKMQKAYQSGMGAEAMRTMLAGMRTEELGLGGAADGVLSRFEASLLTEGSGTQVFSTTFVQWAAREVLRRAQPLTLLARFAPRQRARPMNELLAETQWKPELDPPGSLVDADMGAYYTWLNQQRLEGADQASFLVWFEDHGEAVAIGPRLQRATEARQPVELQHLIEQVAA